MRKKLFNLSLLLSICLFNGCRNVSGSPSVSAGNSNDNKVTTDHTVPIPSENSVTAIITSDLHYTENKKADSVLVPGMAFAEAITDALVDLVIDRHPDVFIMTGDNTNSGDIYDAAHLVSKLQKIKNAGIPIILTTGNHDFNRMDEDDFEAAYFELLDPVDRDPSSLSYTAVIKDVVFLAMDDNAVHPGGSGEFSGATMKWLSEMLEKYKGHQIIFLSHHNVLYGETTEDSSAYRIQNNDLAELLRSDGVRLAMTGHMHFQYILESKGLYEIITAMPFNSGHLIGNLQIDPADDAAHPAMLTYWTESIDFEKYGSGFAQAIRAADAENASYMNQVFSGLMDKEKVRGRKKQAVLDLLGKYFLYFREGSIAEHAAELMSDPAYENMLKALWNHNYGPWIKSTVETTKISSSWLQIPLGE